MTKNPLTTVYIISFLLWTGHNLEKNKNVVLAFVPNICGTKWIYALEKQKQCDPFITDCKNSWKNYLTRYQHCLNAIKTLGKVCLASPLPVNWYLCSVLGWHKLHVETESGENKPPTKKAVGFVAPLAVMCRTLELPGREEVPLALAGTVLALGVEMSVFLCTNGNFHLQPWAVFQPCALRRTTGIAGVQVNQAGIGSWENNRFSCIWLVLTQLKRTKVGGCWLLLVFYLCICRFSNICRNWLDLKRLITRNWAVWSPCHSAFGDSV